MQHEKTINTKTDDLDSNTETEIIIVNFPSKMCSYELQNISSNSVTPEEVVLQIRRVTDLLKRQLENLHEPMRGRLHEKTTPLGATPSSSGSGLWSDKTLILYTHWASYILPWSSS